MPAIHQGPYSRQVLADGTILTVEHQASFRQAARMAHSIGLAEHHRLVAPMDGDPLEPGDPAWLMASVDAALDGLARALPVYEEPIAQAVHDYIELARAHDDIELCHHCSDTTFGAASPQFGDSGLNADLFSLLS